MIYSSDLLALLASAFNKRKAFLEKCHQEKTDCYRLFHGTVEGVSGLTVDRYGKQLLIQSFHESIDIHTRQKMIDFYPIESSLVHVKADIMKGAALGDSLSKHEVYDHKLVSMVKVAEQINKLDEMFEKLTEQYNEDIEHQTKMIGVILEPLIIIVIGVIVGVIMIAMYSPMFDLSKIIG